MYISKNPDPLNLIGTATENKTVIGFKLIEPVKPRGHRINRSRKYVLKCNFCGKITYATPNMTERMMNAECQCRRFKHWDKVGMIYADREVTGIEEVMTADETRREFVMKCIHCGRIRRAVPDLVFRGELTPCHCQSTRAETHRAQHVS